MAYSFRNPSDGIIKHYLETSKIIAVVGLSDREETTSHRVSKEMQERGYRIIPVNPRAAGGQILGETVYASLQEIPFPVDIVDVYRRSEFLPDVARDFIEIGCEDFLGTTGAGKSRSRRNPSWSWTRRYRHEPLYQTRTHPTDLRRLPIRFINDKTINSRTIEENPSRKLGFSSYSYFSFVAWMACKMARSLFDLFDLIVKCNLAIDKIRHSIKTNDIAREVIQEVPSKQG